MLIEHFSARAPRRRLLADGAAFVSLTADDGMAAAGVDATVDDSGVASGAFTGGVTDDVVSVAGTDV